MGLWWPRQLPGQARPKPRPKPRYALAYALMLVREFAIIVGGLALLLVLPWP